MTLNRRVTVSFLFPSVRANRERFRDYAVRNFRIKHSPTIPLARSSREVGSGAVTEETVSV
jgi:hypothetical protein